MSVDCSLLLDEPARYWAWAVCVAYQWQTLIASLIALFAAIIIISKMRHQIELQKKQIEGDDSRFSESKNSKSWSARAHLVDALNGVYIYSEKCVAWIAGGSKDDSMPELPHDAIATLKDCIQFVRPDVAKALFRITTFYQIHDARISSYDFRSNPIKRADRIFDSLKLKSLSVRVFEYGRGDDDDILDSDVSYDEMDAAFSSYEVKFMTTVDPSLRIIIRDTIDRRCGKKQA